MSLPCSFSVLKPLLVLLVFLTILSSTCGSVRCREKERLALLDFKKSFVSFPRNDGMLSSWKSTKQNCCTWEGITCDNLTGHVVSLNLCSQFLESYQLRPSLLELQHLRILNLSKNDFTIRIPEFIGSFRKLTILDLSNAGFFGRIPPHLGNLSTIQTLYLSYNQLFGDNFHWLSHLSSLKTLDLSNSTVSHARDWLSTIRKLPLLVSFECSSCSLPSPIFPSVSSNYVNFSTSLQILDLSQNNLSSSTISFLMKSTSDLLELYLRDLNLEGPFPDVFQDMISLETLDLSYNGLEGGIFKSIGNLCHLKQLHASGCALKQSLSDVLQTLTACASSSLEVLDLSLNNLTGIIPPMLKFPSLIELELSHNCLDGFHPQNSTLLKKIQFSDTSSNDFINGNLQNSLCLFPASLGILSMSFNSLNGVLLDAHFTNYSNLIHLHLSNNVNLSIHFGEAPTQINSMLLSSCKLGLNFPSWLLKQNSILNLDISNCNISGSIPIRFWRNLPSSLSYLNLSSNSFHDIVPNLPFQFSSRKLIIDLSSNVFCGPIPFSLFKAHILLLSQNNFSSFTIFSHSNNFSGFTSFLHSNNFSNFSDAFNYLDISYNSLTGILPDWIWSVMHTLNGLNLANNNLSGTIPIPVGNTSIMCALSLSNNSFSGPLHLWLKNYPHLRILDLSGNKFSGFIPSWIGENIKNLFFLSLKSNNLMGTIPKSLCHLNSLQILDLSYNHLSGSIPSCVHNFTAMASNIHLNLRTIGIIYYNLSSVSQIDGYFYYPFIKWKGMNRKFQKNLRLVKFIDLSNNNLSGEIPAGLASLEGLISLDLSSNNLYGSIPEHIGQLKSLELLNLSYNRLDGQIPSSLSSISSLEILDLSHNNLSGRIPSGTQLQSFSSSAFNDNRGLCGLPVPIKCPGDGEHSILQSSAMDDGDKRPEKQCFYAGMETGFAFGFLGILGTLKLIRKWRHAFFRIASGFAEWIMLTVALSHSRIQRRLCL